MKHILVLIICLGLLPLKSISQSFTVDFFPEKDNSIYSEGNTLSNGSGFTIFAGRTQSSAIRRALVKFNLSSIPTNAIISNATFQMAVVKATYNLPLSHNFTLNKLLKDWGEGSSIALGQGGQGGAAQGNDATWLYAKYGTLSTWTTAGGDFSPTISATAVGILNDFCIWSSPIMKEDIAAWVSSPTSNFGWIIKGEESTEGSAKGFASKEDPVIPKPQLTITYSLPATDKILINEVNPSKKWIEFYNPSANTVNLANYWLINGTSSDNVGGGNVVVLNGNLALNAGKYIVVRWTNLGQNTGEIALFNKNPTDNTAIMKDYVQYGVGNQSKATAAVTAHVWDYVNTFLQTNILTNTYSLNPTGNYLSGNDTNSTSWLIQKETPTYKNEICPSLLTLSGTLVDATYQSTGQLKSTGSVSSNQHIKLNSESSILLENLFFVNSGAVFEAKIVGCNN